MIAFDQNFGFVAYAINSLEHALGNKAENRFFFLKYCLNHISQLFMQWYAWSTLLQWVALPCMEQGPAAELQALWYYFRASAGVAQCKVAPVQRQIKPFCSNMQREN